MNYKQAYQVIREAFEILGPRADKEGIGSLSKNEQAIVVLAWACGVICTDGHGFRFFYQHCYFKQNQNMVPYVVDGFVALGLKEAADATLKSAEFFPPGVLDRGPEAVRQHMNSKLWEFAFFDPCDKTMRKIREDIYEALAKLVFREGIVKDYRDPEKCST
jgi:heterodisulfide reductase subunit B